MAIFYVNTYNSSGTYPYDTVATAAKTFHELISGLGGNFKDGDSIYAIRLFYHGTETAINESATPSEILIKYKNNISIVGCDGGGIPLPNPVATTVGIDDFSPLFNFYKCANVQIKNIAFAKTASQDSPILKFDSCYTCSVSNCKFEYSEPGTLP